METTKYLTEQDFISLAEQDGISHEDAIGIWESRPHEVEDTPSERLRLHKTNLLWLRIFRPDKAENSPINT